MTENIENCPHCGGEGTLKIIQTPFMHGWVGCQKCKIYKNWQYSPKEAVAVWNRRAQ